MALKAGNQIIRELSLRGRALSIEHKGRQGEVNGQKRLIRASDKPGAILNFKPNPLAQYGQVGTVDVKGKTWEILIIEDTDETCAALRGLMLRRSHYVNGTQINDLKALGGMGHDNQVKLLDKLNSRRMITRGSSLGLDFLDLETARVVVAEAGALLSERGFTCIIAKKDAKTLYTVDLNGRVAEKNIYYSNAECPVTFGRLQKSLNYAEIKATGSSVFWDLNDVSYHFA